MTVYILQVEGRFIGRFNSPVATPFHYRWCCTSCGEHYATRVGENPGSWVFLQDHCRPCRSKLPVTYLRYQEFRIPKEVQVGFAPVEILAEEFLFDMAAFAKELASYERDQSPAGAEPGESDDASGASGLRPEGDPVR